MSSAARGKKGNIIEKVVDNSGVRVGKGKIVSRGQLRPAPRIRCMIILFFVWRWLINWINCFEGIALELEIPSFKISILSVIRSMAVFDGILTLLTLDDRLIDSYSIIFILHDIDHGYCGDKKHMFDT